MATFLVGSDIYDISNARKKKFTTNKSESYYAKSYNPLVTVIVPAHNEQRSLKRNLLSIASSTYKKIELIIVNDCSTDKTAQIAINFQRKFLANFKKIKVINVNVRGKAKALNQGLKYAHGSLFMCLDADSTLSPDAITNAVGCFREKALGSLSANVKILPDKGLLNLLQRIEYLIGYQMKKGETFTRTQYIIGGVGSMYRMRHLRKLKFYETDTITEDIDLSMKFIEIFGKKKYVGYNPSVIVFTEAVLNISDLLNQRFRWKYGRYQVFLKRHNLFLSLNPNHYKLLSWVRLPNLLFAELTTALEPLTLLLVFYLIAKYGNFSMVIGSIITFCFCISILVTGASQSYTLKERIKFVTFAPLAFFLMYILSYVEYIATMRGVFSFKKLLHEYRQGGSNCEWVPVTRQDAALNGLNK